VIVSPSSRASVYEHSNAGSAAAWVAADDLVREPDPEERLRLDPAIAEPARKLEGVLELLQLAGILVAALSQEARVEDAAAAEREERLGPVELLRGAAACLRAAGEERLLVEQVGALQRIGDELERLVPAARAAELGHASRRSISSHGRVLRI
jgi:hypothetical protein